MNKVQIKGDEQLEVLTSRQHMALIAIAHLPFEDTTLMNIAKKLGTTKQTANKLITSLVKKGYVRTLPSKINVLSMWRLPSRGNHKKEGKTANGLALKISLREILLEDFELMNVRTSY